MTPVHVTDLMHRNDGRMIKAGEDPRDPLMQRAFDESRRRYLAGLATVLDVLNAMNGMQQAELGVIR